MTSKVIKGMCVTLRNLVNQILSLFFIVTPMVAIKPITAMDAKIRSLFMMTMQRFPIQTPNLASCGTRMCIWDQDQDTEKFGG